MGANVCPKYEGVFRDHPEYSHSNSSNGVWNIPLTPSSPRRVSPSRTFLSILDERASMVRVAHRCLMFAAVDINTLPKLRASEHTDAPYKS